MPRRGWTRRDVATSSIRSRTKPRLHSVAPRGGTSARGRKHIPTGRSRTMGSHSERGRGRGSYYRALPLDFALLELLPDDGLVAGVHWRGRRARHLADEINDRLAGVDDLEPFTAVQIQARLRSMHVVGHVVNHPSGQSSLDVWARTASGVELLGRKNEVLGLPGTIPTIGETHDPT